MVNMKFRNKNKANMGMGNSWSWVTCHLRWTALCRVSMLPFLVDFLWT